LDRITIVGMGPIGASIGLALRRAGLEDTEVVGADGDRRKLARASKMGAVDNATGNLRSALKGAQLVVLDVPFTDMRETLEAIGPALEDGCVVTDTGRVKAPVIRWARDHLPPSPGFVGGRPLPARTIATLEQADAGLFDGTHYCVVADEAAESEAVRSVVGMVEALGASPLFMSAEEHDSYSAALAQLPRLLSTALVGAAAESAAWQDMHRLAVPEFAEMTRPAAGDPSEASAESAANADALAHWLNIAIARLGALKAQVEDGGGDLRDSLVRAWEHRARWEAGAVEEEGGFDSPSAAQSMASLVLGGRLTKRYRQMTSTGKGPAWMYHGGRGTEQP